MINKLSLSVSIFPFHSYIDSTLLIILTQAASLLSTRFLGWIFQLDLDEKLEYVLLFHTYFASSLAASPFEVVTYVTVT